MSNKVSIATMPAYHFPNASLPELAFLSSSIIAAAHPSIYILLSSRDLNSNASINEKLHFSKEVGNSWIDSSVLFISQAVQTAIIQVSRIIIILYLLISFYYYCPGLINFVIQKRFFSCKPEI